MKDFRIYNNQKYQEQLQLRYNLMIVNRIANISTLIWLTVVAIVLFLRTI